jgi:predicted nucleic acid-binding protein
MKYLLDVNVLVAWGWVDHSDHLRAARWIGAMKKRRGARLFTSAIPELGFVRVSVQRTAGRLPVAAAAEVLSGMIGSLGKCGGFVPDDHPSSAAWPEWCCSASRTTDAHLFGLASHHGLCLATLDEGIPGAYLIPESVD